MWEMASLFWGKTLRREGTSAGPSATPLRPNTGRLQTGHGSATPLSRTTIRLTNPSAPAVTDRGQHNHRRGQATPYPHQVANDTSRNRASLRHLVATQRRCFFLCPLARLNRVRMCVQHNSWKDLCATVKQYVLSSSQKLCQAIFAAHRTMQ